jgi:hypothetical protein
MALGDECLDEAFSPVALDFGNQLLLRLHVVFGKGFRGPGFRGPGFGTGFLVVRCGWGGLHGGAQNRALRCMHRLVMLNRSMKGLPNRLSYRLLADGLLLGSAVVAARSLFRTVMILVTIWLAIVVLTWRNVGAAAVVVVVKNYDAVHGLLALLALWTRTCLRKAVDGCHDFEAGVFDKVLVVGVGDRSILLEWG